METLNNVQNKLHHLAQFLAAFSNSYLPKAEDDSQSNLKWSVAEKSLISRSVDNVYLSLSYQDLMLKAIKNDTIKTLDIPGLTHDAIDVWIRKTIAGFGLDASAFHYKLGFRLETPFENFTDLNAEDKKAISALTKQRNMAERALKAIWKMHTAATDIRIWPHHFDTGMLIDISREKDLSKGIGLGYAIADRVCKVPYFYGYAWPYSDINYENPPMLKHGIWIIEDWKGAIITANMRYTAAIVTAFYKEIITCYRKML